MGGRIENRSENYVGRETEEAYIKRMLEGKVAPGENLVGVSNALNGNQAKLPPKPKSGKTFIDSYFDTATGVLEKPIGAIVGGIQKFGSFLGNLGKKKGDWSKTGDFLSR